MSITTNRSSNEGLPCRRLGARCRVPAALWQEDTVHRGPQAGQSSGRYPLPLRVRGRIRVRKRRQRFDDSRAGSGTRPVSGTDLWAVVRVPGKFRRPRYSALRQHWRTARTEYPIVPDPVDQEMMTGVSRILLRESRRHQGWDCNGSTSRQPAFRRFGRLASARTGVHRRDPTRGKLIEEAEPALRIPHAGRSAIFGEHNPNDPRFEASGASNSSRAGSVLRVQARVRCRGYAVPVREQRLSA